MKSWGGAFQLNNMNAKDDGMEKKKTTVCICENCGSEAEMAIKCEEVVLESKPAVNAPPPEAKQVERTINFTQRGNEAEMMLVNDSLTRPRPRQGLLYPPLPLRSSKVKL